MTRNEYNAIINNNKVYEIEYKSNYSRGKLVIDTKYYDKCSKKILKALKDCTIISMMEVNK